MIETLINYIVTSGFGQFQFANLIMIAIGCLFIFLAIKKGFEPLLLVPIGFGILIGNIPYNSNQLPLSVYDGPVSDRELHYFVGDEPLVVPSVDEQGRITTETLPAYSEVPEHVRHHAGAWVHEGKAVMVNAHAIYSAPKSVEVTDTPQLLDLGQGRTIYVANSTETVKPVVDESGQVVKPGSGKFPQVWSQAKQDPFNASVFYWLYAGVGFGFFPPLIFLGVGALTDFGPMLSNPRTLLLGAAAQFGIFGALLGAVMLGFDMKEAASIGIIGGADGPTAIFTCTTLAPHLLGAVALAAYSYMALVPIIQPPIMKLLTTREERLIRMPIAKPVSKTTKVIFPVVGFLLTTFIAPGALPLLGMLFFGNLLRECMVTDRLAKTAQTTFIDIVTILLGVTVGAKTNAANFLTEETIFIFVLGIIAFGVATATGVLFAKFMNKVSKNPINPLIGAAGVSAVPMAARVAHNVGLKEDPQNFLLMHAMGPNVAGVIGSAVAAGVLLSKYATL